MKYIIFLFTLVSCIQVQKQHLGDFFPRGISSIQQSTINGLDPHGSYLLTVEMNEYEENVPTQVQGMVATYARYQGLKIPVFVRLSTMKIGMDVYFQKVNINGSNALVEVPLRGLNPKNP